MIEEFPGQDSIAPKYVTKKAEVQAKVEKSMDEFEKKDHTMDPNASTERGG